MAAKEHAISKGTKVANSPASWKQREQGKIYDYDEHARKGRSPERHLE